MPITAYSSLYVCLSHLAHSGPVASVPLRTRLRVWHPAIREYDVLEGCDMRQLDSKVRGNPSWRTRFCEAIRLRIKGLDAQFPGQESEGVAQPRLAMDDLHAVVLKAGTLDNGRLDRRPVGHG